MSGGCIIFPLCSLGCWCFAVKFCRLGSKEGEGLYSRGRNFWWRVARMCWLLHQTMGWGWYWVWSTNNSSCGLCGEGGQGWVEESTCRSWHSSTTNCYMGLLVDYCMTFTRWLEGWWVIEVRGGTNPYRDYPRVIVLQEYDQEAIVLKYSAVWLHSFNGFLVFSSHHLCVSFVLGGFAQ